MRIFFGHKQNNQMLLDVEEYNHIKNVLRFDVGEEVLVSDGGDYFYRSRLTTLKKNEIKAEIIQEVECNANPRARIALFFANSKGDKNEFVLQKATELGASQMFIFNSEFSVKKGENLARLEKITREACKQCGRSIPVRVEVELSLGEVLEKLKGFDRVIFLNERERNKSLTSELIGGGSHAIIVGSEGGFSEREAAEISGLGNVVSVGLGERILRAQTAAVAGVAFVSFILGA